jgi:predicted CopG family antitoxin
MTITLDADVYDGLNRMVGKRRISQFISDLVRPHVSDSALDAGYRDMAGDVEREGEAAEWIEALGNDGSDAAR